VHSENRKFLHAIKKGMYLVGSYTAEKDTYIHRTYTSILQTKLTIMTMSEINHIKYTFFTTMNYYTY